MFTTLPWLSVTRVPRTRGDEPKEYWNPQFLIGKVWGWCYILFGHRAYLLVDDLLVDNFENDTFGLIDLPSIGKI